VVEKEPAAPVELPVRDYHEGSVFHKIPDELVLSCREAARALEAFLGALEPGTDLEGWIEPWFAPAQMAGGRRGFR
jgi:hypothetical protein